MQVRLERLEQLGPRHPDTLSSALVVAGEALAASSIAFCIRQQDSKRIQKVDQCAESRRGGKGDKARM